MKHYVIALTGNPNVGKSAWINRLADTDFKVGNWPGVTIDKREARVYRHGNCYHLIDLPGTYSLEEERDEGRICAAYLKHEKVDLIVNVCDSIRLKRNLNLTMHLRELQLPMIVVCSFADEAKRKGIEIDVDFLSACLQVPCCFLSAYDKSHRALLWQMIEDNCRGKRTYTPLFNASLRPLLDQLSVALHSMDEHERNACIYAYMRGEEVSVLSDELKRRQKNRSHQECRQRYESVLRQLEEGGVKRKKQRKAYTVIDRIVLHPLLAYPLCIAFFFFFLQMVFQGSLPWSDFIQYLLQEHLLPWMKYYLQSWPQVLRDFFLEGVLNGIGSVISFIPLMGTLYFWIAFLEESGYYARIAFLCDRIMSYFHLSGKAFFAMILGFGCNVPGIIASKSMETQKQRMLTALLVPFMSCGARLPLYLLFCASFFRGKEAAVIASVYAMGLFAAFLSAFILSKRQMFREDVIRIMELPPYRFPNMKVLGKSAVLECINYLRKAFSAVLMVMMVLWCFAYLPYGVREKSYLASAAQHVSVVFEPLGFGDKWECVAALPGGIVAKESIVGFLQQGREIEARPLQWQEDMHALVEEGKETMLRSFGLHAAEKDHIRPLQLWNDEKAALKAYSYLIYVLLSIPCIMTLSAIASQYGKRLAMLSVLWMALFSYASSFFIYQLMSLLIF